MPRTLVKTALFLALLVYILAPLDVIPDLFGPLGRIDDLILIALFVWRYYVYPVGSRTASNPRSATPGRSAAAPQTDPFRILELSPQASRREIEAQYKNLMKLYHPDRVAHLGEELRKLAHEKTIEIQYAYHALTSATKS